MNKTFKRVCTAKKEAGLSWDELAKQAGIPVASWMCGLPNSSPSDDELKKIAGVLNTTFEYLKNGNK